MPPSQSNSSQIRIGRDITPLPTPLHPPTKSSPLILVIGAGVTGLVTSWTLLDAGYRVTILAARYADFSSPNSSTRLASQIAGALWEFPPAVCGAHTDPTSLQASKRWCMESYECYKELAATVPEAGVTMVPAAAFFQKPLEDDAVQYAKMREIRRAGVKDLRHSPAIIKEYDVDPAYGVADAYEFQAPVIETDVATRWLMELVRRKGATMLANEFVEGDLLSQEVGLLSRFYATAIVNASGLGAAELANDAACVPLRGALLRVVNDGVDFPKVKAALSISADASDDHEFVFLVPRGDNVLLMGGIAEMGSGALDLTTESEVVKRMRERCEKFLPSLKAARLVEAYPLAQGLRPYRKGGLRVEREGRGKRRIVHSYGHGGSGWSLAFGCAKDVVGLVVEILEEESGGEEVEVQKDVEDKRPEDGADRVWVRRMTRLDAGGKYAASFGGVVKAKL